MSVTYGKAPLVEIISELRWGPESSKSSSGAAIHVSLPRPKDEELLMNFAMLAAQKGYGRLERVVPPGFPTVAGMVACRFRPTETDRPSPLLQVGRGVFTVNAVPPNYHSWATFSPVVRGGIDLLFDAHRRAQMPLPEFSHALVRYVDVFDSQLTGGRSAPAFMRDVMGMRVDLPQAITSIAKSEVEPSIEFEMPIEIGILSIKAGPGARGSERGTLLDTTILVQRQIGANADGAMQALTDARDVIHSLFAKLTESIHEAMEPKQ